MSAVFFHPDTIQTQWVFDTTRKGSEVATYLAERGCAIHSPALITRGVIERYHHHAYLDALESGTPVSLAESQQFDWDPQTWQSVVAQRSSLVAAVAHARIHGRAYALASGFHHARADRGAGFCTLNGLAIAAGEALRTGIRQVIILDLDAHAGGGTHSMVHTWPHLRHVDIHTAPFDSYLPLAPHRRISVQDPATYIPTVTALLKELDNEVEQGDLLLYNAGMDIYEGCDVGGLGGISEQIIEQREILVDSWSRSHGLAVAACLAGGYKGTRFPNELLIRLHADSVTRFCAD